jgi:hypothetical protein
LLPGKAYNKTCKKAKDKEINKENIVANNKLVPIIS